MPKEQVKPGDTELLNAEALTEVLPNVVGGDTNDNPKPINEYEVESLALVTTRFEQADEIRTALTTKWQDWDKQFRSKLATTGDNAKYRSQLFVPITENVIRGMLAKYIVSLFTKKPFFSLQGREASDDEKAERIAKLMEFQFDTMPDFFVNIVRFVQSMLVFGTAFGKVYWRKIARNVRTKNGKYIEVVDYEGAYFEAINIENMFIQPDAVNLNSAWKIHRSWKTKYDLQKVNDRNKLNKEKPTYINLEKITGTGTPPSDGAKITDDARAIRGIPGIVLDPIPEFQPMEILEYWAEDNSRLITVANRQTIIRDIENPLASGDHPFVMATYEPLLFEFYGRGVCEKVKAYQDAVNVLMNQIVENTQYITHKMYKGVAGEVSSTQIVAQPGKIVWLNDINALQEFITTPLPAQVYQLMDRMIQKMEEQTGANNMSTSVGSPITKEQSATEVATMNRLGNEFHGLNLMLLEVPCLTEIVRKAYQLTQQFATKNYLVQVTEKGDWTPIMLSDLSMDVDIKPKVGVDLMSKEAIQNNLVNLINVAKNIPGLDMEKITSMYIENMGYHVETLGKKQDTNKPVATVQDGVPPENPVGLMGELGGKDTSQPVVGEPNVQSVGNV